MISSGLVEKVKALQKEKENERRRIHELNEQYQEKSRQFQKLQVLYDKVKRNIPLSQKENISITQVF
jgi:E3 ubiquitin-protein ligase CCNP1IP1